MGGGGRTEGAVDGLDLACFQPSPAEVRRAGQPVRVGVQPSAAKTAELSCSHTTQLTQPILKNHSRGRLLDHLKVGEGCEVLLSRQLRPPDRVDLRGLDVPEVVQLRPVTTALEFSATAHTAAGTAAAPSTAVPVACKISSKISGNTWTMMPARLSKCSPRIAKDGSYFFSISSTG